VASFIEAETLLPEAPLSTDAPVTRAMRRGAFALALLAAALLHVVFLSALERDAPAPAAGVPRDPTRVAVRTIAAPQTPPSAVGADPAAATARQVAGASPREPRLRSRAPAGGTAVRSDSEAIAGPLAAPQAPRHADREVSAPAAPRVSDGSDTTLASVGAARPDEMPIHATIIPPPATLSYRMRRGSASGSAELTWRPASERYEAQLEARVAGVTVLLQTSQGGFDRGGIAPQRFVDRRVRRSALAVNFQREAGVVTFSARSAQITLRAGMQDRLSWMVQLAAIASAEPQHLVPAGRIAIPVVGVRGESVLWQFVCIGEEWVGAEPAATRVFRLQRLPDATYDSHVDVWLDAQRPHWPVRAQWRNGPNDAGLDLWRTEGIEPK
jgi:Protein of unknown function (DUF3108)